MRNQIAYEAYMGFLLKSLFWIGFICIIVVFILILIDALFILLAPRCKADVVRSGIVPIGKKTRFVDAHGVFILYSFSYKNQTYESYHLNSYGRVTVNGYYKALDILNNNIKDNQITVYICPFKPKLSIVLPFQGIFALKLELLIILLGFLISAIILDYI
ncbi:hypothetical protein MOMA_02170 [Moraxella macacae 0408225]|uniref:DUF3592 domain-containing protein n=1 Tax=Moraxella macacae 0408225 TaxID=1230338 RepID=L2F8F8_9GAMM|nr:hypothetical protein [Moraxella macacae]ELA09175.1 hypothetical protein MOMA_02170 [Moraxella macacae 0408225]